MIKVSVIVPVFNTEEYIGECLDSILAQSLQEIEVICINDGSTDHSLEILQEYATKDDRVTVLDQLNAGQSVSRNRGLQKAKGEYVYFMDSDDLITSHMLEETYSLCKEKNLDVLYFSGTSFFENDNLKQEQEWFSSAYYRKGDYTEVVEGPQMLKLLYDQGAYFVSPCLQIIRREYIEENNLQFPEGIVHEDNSFTFKALLSAKRVFCVNDIYFYRRVRTESVVTKDRTHKNLWGYFYCLMDLLEYDKQFHFYDVDINNRIAQVLTSLNGHVRRIYADLPTREQALFLSQCSPYETIVFKSMFLENIQIQKRNGEEIARLKKENAELRKQTERINRRFNEIKNSRSYKLGRTLSSPYRLAKKGVKSYSQHGLAYTCKRALEKVKKLK